MTRRTIIIILFLSAISITVVVFRPRQAKVPVSIRIAGVATNTSSGRVETEWNAAVPKSRSHRAAVLFWSVHYEETNKTSVQYSTIRLSPTESDLMGVTLAPNEDGILSWGVGQTLNPEKVYRVVGAYWEPNRIESFITSGQKIPVLRRLVPSPKAAFATSEWVEVTMDIESETKRE